MKEENMEGVRILREKRKSRKGKYAVGDFHLAGVIPVTGAKLDFNMPWHDSLMPIAQDYLAIEHAVYECACAGVNTIWIACKEGTTPLLRHRIGDWVYDPVEIDSVAKNPRSKQKTFRRIPIYYVKIKPIDFQRRESLGWSTLVAAFNSFRMSFRVSKWVVPDKYYVSFPYGIYDADFLRKKRHMFRSSKSYVVSHEGKSIVDGLQASFTFDRDVFVYARREIRKYETELDQIFKSVMMDNPTKIELPWFHQIDSWEGYKNYMSSPESDLVEKHIANANGTVTFQKTEGHRTFNGVAEEN